MATITMPPPTYPSASVLSRPASCHSLGSSSYRSYAPRKPSPLAEGGLTSRPSSVFLGSPYATPPDSPKSSSFTDTGITLSTSNLLCPKPTHTKSLPTRVHTVRRPATAPYTSKTAPPPSSPHPHRRSESSSVPTVMYNPASGAIEENPRQMFAPQTEVSFRPVMPSTSRAPEENWMTSESAPRFSRHSLVLGTVVLPVRKEDAQRLKRQSGLKAGTHVKYATAPNTAMNITPAPSNVNPFGSLNETAVKKWSHNIPSVRVEDVDGTTQTINEADVDLSKRDGTGKRKARKLSKDFVAKVKIRSGQVKPTMIVIREKCSNPVLTEKPAVGKGGSGPDPLPSATPSKRTRSIWRYILASSR